MNKAGPIIIIDDDAGDQQLLNIVFEELQLENEVIFFSDGEQAFGYLTMEAIEPFLVLSDINMPKLNGLELREKVNSNEELKLKCIPYLLFSTSAEQNHVVEAYSKSVQGFFVKPNSIEELRRTIQIIVAYWRECESPHYVK